VLVVGAVLMAANQTRAVQFTAAGLVALAAAMLMRVVTSPRGDLFSFDSAYQNIRIVDERTAGGRMERVLMMGGGGASGIYASSGETSFAYTLAAERLLRESGARNALVIGAAGFTFPRDAAKFPGIQRIDAVDVDPAVRNIAEQRFLRAPLPEKVRFIPESARFAVRKLARSAQHYGFTFVDTYYGKGIPDELVTAEFFRDVRAVSDRTVVNAVLDRDLESDFARNLLASFREAYGTVWLMDAKPDDDSFLTNYLVMSRPATGSDPWNASGWAYHDDRNNADRDRVALMWGP